MNFGIPLGMAGVTFVLALFFGIVIDVVFLVGGNYFWVNLVLAVLLAAFVFWLTPFLIKFERRHDQESIETSEKLGETKHHVAAAIVASHQYGGHGNGHG